MVQNMLSSFERNNMFLIDFNILNVLQNLPVALNMLSAFECKNMSFELILLNYKIALTECWWP